MVFKLRVKESLKGLQHILDDNICVNVSIILDDAICDARIQ